MPGFSSEPLEVVSVGADEPSKASSVEQKQWQRDGQHQSHSGVQKSAWPQSSAIITGEAMGTGILSLPYACAHLGWFVGIGSCLLFGAASSYSGWLLTECKLHHFPRAESYSDLAHATGGAKFGYFTSACILVSWACLLPYYLIACIDAMMVAFPEAELCFWRWALIVMLFMAPPLQLRSLHLLSFLSFLSTGAIIAVVLLLLPALAVSAPAVVETSALPAAGMPPLEFYGYFSAFIFAYQGQSVFLEVMREMRNPAYFPRAAMAANMLMAGTYTAITIVAYGTHGRAVAAFLPATLPAGPARVAVGLLLAFHTLVSYLLTGQPLHRHFHNMIFPHTAEAGGCLAMLHWAVVTLSCLGVSFVLANSIPFFGQVQALLGALSGGPILFGWPAYFYLKGCRLTHFTIPTLHLGICVVFICVFLPTFTAFGTVNAVGSIADACALALATPARYPP